MSNLLLVSNDILSKFVDKLMSYLSPESLHVIFDAIPIVDASYNDGCDPGIHIGNNKYYITSAAKQKRAILSKLNKLYGIDTVMCEGNYVRINDIDDETHSQYLTQYDWECKIDINDRNIDTLKSYVNKIWKSIYYIYVHEVSELGPHISIQKGVTYVTAQELLDIYGTNIVPDDRVNKYMIDNNINVLFISGIGSPLSDGKPHDDRTDDYDDHNLNGDLYVWHNSLEKPLELMSCGIRVNKEVLLKQCNNISGPYHESIINGKYVQSIGGGLGKERLIMYLFNFDHIKKTRFQL